MTKGQSKRDVILEALAAYHKQAKSVRGDIGDINLWPTSHELLKFIGSRYPDAKISRGTLTSALSEWNDKRERGTRKHEPKGSKVTEVGRRICSVQIQKAVVWRLLETDRAVGVDIASKDEDRTSVALVEDGKVKSSDSSDVNLGSLSEEHLIEYLSTHSGIPQEEIREKITGIETLRIFYVSVIRQGTHTLERSKSDGSLILCEINPQNVNKGVINPVCTLDEELFTEEPEDPASNYDPADLPYSDIANRR